ncbi:hypothetical protein HaLaN_19012 [Haematococcus lacustris]|uniref:Uncharacterized protein n=1 Tax=Haematococcus lacustris TaxID=44745 RepID=A0A699ZKV2_HAELA|nr:hypothetical protein HaLaN_19012 [Haematococcus lacustris]
MEKAGSHDLQGDFGAWLCHAKSCSSHTRLAAWRQKSSTGASQWTTSQHAKLLEPARRGSLMQMRHEGCKTQTMNVGWPGRALPCGLRLGRVVSSLPSLRC